MWHLALETIYLLVPPKPLTTLAALPTTSGTHTQHHVTLLFPPRSLVRLGTLLSRTSRTAPGPIVSPDEFIGKTRSDRQARRVARSQTTLLEKKFFYFFPETHGNKNLNTSTAFISTSIIHNLHRRNAAKAQRNARSKPGETSPLFLFLWRIAVDQSLCRWSTGAATTAGTPWRSTGTWPQSCCTILGARMSWAGRAKKTDERRHVGDGRGRRTGETI